MMMVEQSLMTDASVVAMISFINVTFGKNLALVCRSLISLAMVSERVHRNGACPFSAKIPAIAVPQPPAPMMPIECFILITVLFLAEF